MLYASILMSLSSTHHCTGNAAKGDRLYAELYEEGIIGKCAQDLEWSKLATEREKAFIAMAYSECSLGHLMNDKYEEARKFPAGAERSSSHLTSLHIPPMVNRARRPHTILIGPTVTTPGALSASGKTEKRRSSLPLCWSRLGVLAICSLEAGRP